MLSPRWMWLLVGQLVILHVHSCVKGMALHGAAHAHSGLCPNDVNPNLWVDAMSTCTRECQSDQECETFEKCCSNVCGSQSCVAARYVDTTGKKGPVAKEATCDKFVCTQQGSECHIWNGQPVCKCRDRCEREPHFTCASDGMTYYNKCYMDAEACTKGISLSVVTCRSHPTNTSPLPPGTTALPTTTLLHTTPLDVQAPVIAGSLMQQSVYVGETASFLCEVNGWPKPEITWEKQLEGKENVIMKPNHVLGNVVVTNIGQLVIYSAQLEDAGVYTCTATNSGGSIQAHFPLSVLQKKEVEKVKTKNSTRFPPEECLKVPDSGDCGGEKQSWYYDSKRNSCFTFTYGNCGGNRNHFDTFELCMLSCQGELAAPCNLPSLQGPCKAYEPRWAYSTAQGQCQPFVYGGCGGNENNFETREACEDSCPFPRNHHCKPCKPRHKMVASFCKSDFVILGRVMELTEDDDTGRAQITVEEILKDEKMGLKFFQKEPLEVTLQNMGRSCPCPNVTVSDGQIIVMGDVHNGMAVLQPDSFVSPFSARRVRRLREVINKNTCDILKEFIQ
ncbi:WAP, Kazal, immunoglobulin, Kunitz and NTR domain-containing protein 2 [Colossoma macropomum]|uniref:WAP, Kazal, immunoglobulin, Kunitz and NTR domain-containing protein 2 n=1 Tax=Colossoma macropomum TaxID=42526 RepID=UPI0018653D15|nr:WAP, Kazal, immunoglobulin, Kunitz and NTR domain-containing protein 2 [Colossoma macropomum]